MLARGGGGLAREEALGSRGCMEPSIVVIRAPLSLCRRVRLIPVAQGVDQVTAHGLGEPSSPASLACSSCGS